MSMTVLSYKSLTATEEALVAEIMRNSTMIKYFQVLAHNIAVEIATCPIAFEEAPEEYIRKQHMKKGQLDLLETLAIAHEVAAQIPQQD